MPLHDAIVFLIWFTAICSVFGFLALLEELYSAYISLN